MSDRMFISMSIGYTTGAWLVRCALDVSVLRVAASLVKAGLDLGAILDGTGPIACSIERSTNV